MSVTHTTGPARPGGPAAAKYGTPEKLQAVSEGYFGMLRVFATNLVLGIGLVVSARFVDLSQFGFPVVPLAIGVLMVLVLALSLPNMQRFAVGMDWPPAQGVLAALLLGVNAAVGGLVGIAILAVIAFGEFKRYGVASAGLGYRRRDVDVEVIARKRERNVRSV